MTAAPLLEMRGIVKRFGGTLALDGVFFDLRAGEIHALVGENGAGKSTLMKVLAGGVAADAGVVLVEGRIARIDAPAQALAMGVGMIHQDLALVPGLSGADNIVLGHEATRGGGVVVDRRENLRRARAALAQVGQDIDLSAPVGPLGAAQRQIVAIARALSRRVRILALDEPTAPLSSAEAAALFRVLRRLRGEGAGIVYISHRLEEIFAVADRITVLRDGRVVHSGPASALDRPRLVNLMVGRAECERPTAAGARAGDEVLRLEDFEGAGFRAVNLALRRGEIVGLAGLVGAGRSELALAIFGARTRRGRMFVQGREVHPKSPREAIDAGVGLLTEDRDRHGLIPGMLVRENITLSNLRALSRGPFVRRAHERGVVRELVERLAIRPPTGERRVAALSGGNRQKVVLARWLHARPRVLIFDEPTAGVDVGAREEIHGWVRELADEGRAILLISSDLPELLALSDRVLVMRRGDIVSELSREQASPERVMELATGVGRA